MPIAELNPTQQMLLFFVDKGGGHISRTKLVKLMYMADLEATRFLGRPISDLRWAKDDFGPFDPQFYAVESSLRSDSQVVVEAIPLPDGGEWHRYRVGRRPPPCTISATQMQILADVFKAYGAMNTETFKKQVVYKTAPFLAVQNKPDHTRIPMEIVSGDDGISEEDERAGLERIRSGQGVPLAAALDAIQRRR